MKQETGTFLRLFHVILSFLAALQVPFATQAEIKKTGTYSGFYFSNTQYDLDSNSGNDRVASWGHLKGKLGKTIVDDYLAVEGQLGLITKSGSDHGLVSYSGFLRAAKEFEHYRPYGLLGFSAIYLYQDGVESVSETGFSWGAGVELKAGKKLALAIEYINFLDQSTGIGSLSYDAIGIGFTYYFTRDTSYFNKQKIESIRD